MQQSFSHSYSCPRSSLHQNLHQKTHIEYRPLAHLSPKCQHCQNHQQSHITSCPSRRMLRLPATAAVKQSSGGWLGPLTDGLQQTLQYLQHGLEQLHVPYTYGWAIVLLTILVKTATLPLTKIQVESSLAVQNLKPTIDAIKARYGKDQEKIRRETSALYEKAGVKPLAGCLPSIATIPVFIGLYNSLSNVASEGLLDAEGFFWLPSLSGPSSLAARAAGSGTAWLLPLHDGVPPVGWGPASRYLVLPVLLVVAQWVSSALISPPVDPKDENNRTQQLLIAFLPLITGWFALNVPSGLSLYYFANSVITTGQQVWLRKLGGASAIAFDLGPIEVGKARRTGEIASLSAKPLQLEAVGPDLIGETSASGPSATSTVTAANGVEPTQDAATTSCNLCLLASRRRSGGGGERAVGVTDGRQAYMCRVHVR
ncbi:hypothetical protein WJX84_010454 [Apatococcus fuscideae]|uniref:Membrane insertase YidC/Oxa/ALB C-terminal domain-containing protein n=1 Tax=Apatococcus fuscideae TaxID=2026836 RepID=A0AAW1TF84_9CHLO